MKKLLIVLAAVSYFFHLHAHSSSFLMPRSVTHNATLELALDTYHIYCDPTACSPSVQCYATPFYMQSNNKAELARYFLPDNNDCLNIQENGTGNVCSLWLNLIAAPGLSYSSTIWLKPISKTIGSYFYGRMDIGDYCSEKHWWLSNAWIVLSFAAMQVRHSLDLKEQLTGNEVYGTITGITTGIQAFNSPTWCYGKLSPRMLKHSGVDDIQLKMGTNYYFNHDKGRLGCYFVGTIPTGNRPNAQFLFEPLVGTKHGAAGFGIMGDYISGMCEQTQWSIIYDLKYRYLFSGREIRSFDFCENGDWSRYMLLVNEDATSVTLPAINSCTRAANVTPGSQIEYWLALHYAHCQWNVELGYNLWWRAQDTIDLQCPFPPDTGIYDLAGAVIDDPISASTANISESAIGPNKAPSDATFTPSCALNTTSGAQLAALSNSIYLAFSYNGMTCDEYPFLIGLGGGYEFADRHALCQGSIWGKCGIMF